MYRTSTSQGLDIAALAKRYESHYWMPGYDWLGPPSLPTWGKACLRNVDAAAKCFGLILWQAMMERPKAWSFGRYALTNIKIEGMTYFQIDLP